MVKQSTYQELQAKLDAVLATLEDPTIDVDEAVKAHKEGLELVKKLQARLTEAENTINKVQADFSGGQ